MMLEQGMKGWNLWQLTGMVAFHPHRNSGKTRQKISYRAGLTAGTVNQ